MRLPWDSMANRPHPPPAPNLTQMKRKAVISLILFVVYVMVMLAEWLIVRVATVRGGGRALSGLRGMLLPLACCCLPRVSVF